MSPAETVALDIIAVLELARKGAEVWMAVRSPERGNAARQKILALEPNAKVRVVALDLSDLSAVRAFAAAFLSEKQTPRHPGEQCGGHGASKAANHIGWF